MEEHGQAYRRGWETSYPIPAAYGFLYSACAAWGGLGRRQAVGLIQFAVGSQAMRATCGCRPAVVLLAAIRASRASKVSRMLLI